MLKTIKNISAFIALTLVSSQSFASLIVNGSFEQLEFEDKSISLGEVFNTNLQAFDNKNRGWDVFTELPGWTTALGNGIELQKNIVANSQDGQYHVELDSHKSGQSNATMSQTIDSLIIGEEYLLEFFYKPRTNNANDNGINVYWHDSVLDFDSSIEAEFSANSTRSLTPNWQAHSILLTATATSMDISFGSFGKQNTLGGLVDNVSLVGPTSVPEPSMLALFLLPLGFLVKQRYEKQHKAQLISQAK